ncbi:MAG: hypothetical protein DRQ49_16430 [Gammaproteobacteria bacterium]|nr:MAG: hypothetical protein DRQ49_16430 [Gammaproteobacteria bacterium]
MEAIRLSNRILLLKAELGRIVKHFKYELPQYKRDNEYIYKESAKMLLDQEIIKTFELGIK